MSINEDESGTIAVALNDSDPEGTLVVGSMTVVAGVSHGTLVNNGDGTLTYSPATNYHGPDSFQYRISDGSLLSNLATVAITIAQVNDPGSFSGITSGLGLEDAGSITGGLTFVDPIDGFMVGNYQVTTGALHGTASIVAATGSWTYLPNQNSNGSDNFTVSVTDNDGNVETQVVSLTVTPVNDVPAVIGSGPSHAVTQQLVAFSSTFGDIDGDSLTASWNFGDGHTLTFAGTDPQAAVPACRYTSLGSFAVTLTVSDSHGGSVTAPITTVTVSNTYLDGSDLLVGGTNGDDAFAFKPGLNAGEVVVTRGTTKLGTFTPTAAIRAFGGSGSDSLTVNGDAAANLFEVHADRLVLNGLNYLVELVESRTLNALGSGDTIIVFDGTATVNGGSAVDTLIASTPLNNTWNVTAQNAGNLNGQVLFTGIEHLIGNAGNDLFKFSDGVGVSSIVDGGGGADTLDYSAFNTAVSMNLQRGTATKTGGVISVENLIGGHAADTLTGTDTSNIWYISGSSAGDLNGFYGFTSFENLVGGNQTDLFDVKPGAEIGGNLNGGGAIDTLQYASTTSATVNLETKKSTSIVGTFTSIQQIIFGSAVDTLIGPNTNASWMLSGNQAGSVAGVTFQNVDVLSGGTAVDTVRGPNLALNWQLTGADAGTMLGMSWTNVESLVGGTLTDTFSLQAGASLSGVLNGGGGSDVLDYTAYYSSVTVSLAQSTSTSIGAFASVTSFVGSSAADMLIGMDNVNLWTISSATGGTVDATSFSGFEQLRGGNAVDTFRVTQGVSFAGALDGDGGADSLDYAAYTANVVVNLMLGTATGVVSVASLEVIAGGEGNDVLIGNAADNVITGNNGDDVILGLSGNDTLNGGGGRDLMVGGSGADLIHGNNSEDILIGGRLLYADESTGIVNQAALDAIMFEWRRTDLAYAQKIAHLNGNTAGGNNGVYLLDATTIFDDAAVDILYGDAGLDWFLTQSDDQVQAASNEAVSSN